MGIGDFLRKYMRTEERVDATSTGGDGLFSLGFDGLNTNEWLPVELDADRLGDLTHLPKSIPAGGQLIRTPSQLERPDDLLAWVSPEPADHTEWWYQLAGRFPRTGLWPVATASVDAPWLSEDLVDVDDPGAEIEDILDEHYSPVLPQMPERWPGLAAGQRAQGPTPVQPPNEELFLALVPAMCPADVPANIGWDGAVNHELYGTHVSTVLRSWEDRFGAVLVELGANTLKLTVARRPQSAEQAHLLVNEHAAFCPDNLANGNHTYDEYADLLLDAEEWHFFWS